MAREGGSAIERERVALRERLERRTIVLDCRWLGMGGAGRLTEVLLRDLGRFRPPGRWTLWGDEKKLRPFLFAGAGVRTTTNDPRAGWGQRELFSVPAGDVVVYLHQIRPLRPGRSVTFILDTIPLRHGGNVLHRLVKRAFFHAAARVSTRIVTISAFSKASIERDLGVPAGRIHVVPIPIEPRWGQDVIQLRARLPQERAVLYVGRFDRHKNLERLCHAFRRTAFARDGGRLLLVGGWNGEVQAMQAWLDDEGLTALVDARPQCSEDELASLFATSRALVAPALEEGYGLPAFEAAASGLPVAASRTGAMTEMPPEVACLFDPTSVEEMSRAIDEAARRGPVRPYVADVEAPLGDAVVDAVALAIDEP